MLPTLPLAPPSVGDSLERRPRAGDALRTRENGGDSPPACAIVGAWGDDEKLPRGRARAGDALPARARILEGEPEPPLAPGDGIEASSPRCRPNAAPLPCPPRALLLAIGRADKSFGFIIFWIFPG